MTQQIDIGQNLVSGPATDLSTILTLTEKPLTLEGVFSADRRTSMLLLIRGRQGSEHLQTISVVNFTNDRHLRSLSFRHQSHVGYTSYLKPYSLITLEYLSYLSYKNLNTCSQYLYHILYVLIRRVKLQELIEDLHVY
jgi:hypothetical protein